MGIVLLLANTWLFFDTPKAQQLAFDPDQFTITDTTIVQRITLTSGSIQNRLTKANGWVLNDQYKADPVFIQILMNVVSQIKLARPIPVEQFNVLKRDISRAVEVEIVGSHSMHYWVLGNANRTETYLFNHELNTGYLLEIPGYTDYLGSIFELSSHQWRDRVVLNGNWRSIQKLTVDFTENQPVDLLIKFEKDFFSVAGIAEIDSNAVIDYLNLFENFQANERIDISQFPRLDSLQATVPFATVEIEDIYFSEPQRLVIYPRIQNSGIQLAVDTRGEAVIFDARRLMQVLKSPSDFDYQTMK